MGSSRVSIILLMRSLQCEFSHWLPPLTDAHRDYNFFIRAKSKAPASEGSKVLIFTGTGVDLESSSKEVTVSFYLAQLVYRSCALNPSELVSQRMRQLGAIWTDHATEANVLVVKGIMRTEKFLLGKLQLCSFMIEGID